MDHDLLFELVLHELDNGPKLLETCFEVLETTDFGHFPQIVTSFPKIVTNFPKIVTEPTTMVTTFLKIFGEYCYEIFEPFSDVWLNPL